MVESPNKIFLWGCVSVEILPLTSLEPRPPVPGINIFSPQSVFEFCASSVGKGPVAWFHGSTYPPSKSPSTYPIPHVSSSKGFGPFLCSLKKSVRQLSARSRDRPYKRPGHG